MAQKGVFTTADYLPIEEYNRLLTCLHNDGLHVWEMFCVLAYCCQLRCSDVLNLKWSDILYREEFNCLEQKTKKTRRIELNESARAKISDMYVIMGKPDNSQSIMYNPKLKKTYSIQYANQMMKKFKYDYSLEIKNFSTHTFRKTFGRMFWEKTGKSSESIMILSNIFRHSNMKITEAYIGLRHEEISSAYKLIDFKF